MQNGLLFTFLLSAISAIAAVIIACFMYREPSGKRPAGYIILQVLVIMWPLVFLSVESYTGYLIEYTWCAMILGWQAIYVYHPLYIAHKRDKWLFRKHFGFEISHALDTQEKYKKNSNELLKYMSTKDGFTAVCDQLQGAFCVENAYFVRAVLLYQSKCAKRQTVDRSQDPRAELSPQDAEQDMDDLSVFEVALRVYERFIREGALLQVNISSEERLKLDRIFKDARSPASASDTSPSSTRSFDFSMASSSLPVDLFAGSLRQVLLLIRQNLTTYNVYADKYQSRRGSTTHHVSSVAVSAPATPEAVQTATPILGPPA